MEEISFGDEVIILQVRRDQDKTIPLGSIRKACENFSKCLKFSLELRSESGLRRSMLLSSRHIRVLGQFQINKKYAPNKLNKNFHVAPKFTTNSNKLKQLIIS